MKIYLGASYHDADAMRGVRDVLQVLDHEITSRWLSYSEHHKEPLTAEHLNDDPVLGRVPANMDMNDLQEADMLVLFTSTPSSSGGFHTELGMAIAWGKKIVIVGPRLNVFHCLPSIEHYQTWSQFVLSIAGPYWAEKKLSGTCCQGSAGERRDE